MHEGMKKELRNELMKGCLGGNSREWMNKTEKERKKKALTCVGFDDRRLTAQRHALHRTQL